MKKLLLSIAFIISIYSCGSVESTSNNQKWKVTYFVDSFGDPTENGYITNVPAILGTFSNSATTNSKLKVDFIIDIHEISIVLWEYGNLKVKALSYEFPTDYNILIKHNGLLIDKKFRAKNTSDRVTLVSKSGYTEPIEFLKYLKKGGQLKISITEINSNGSSYSFELNTEELDLAIALNKLYN